jgi:hypothetical protein
MTKIQCLWDAYRWFNLGAVIDDVAALFGYATWIAATCAVIGRTLNLDAFWIVPLMLVAFWGLRRLKLAKGGAQ